MINLKNIDVRIWILISFCMMIILMAVQAVIDNKNEDQEQAAIQKEYDFSANLQIEIHELKSAHSNQIGALKDLLLRGKDTSLYHIQLSNYFSQKRIMFDQLDKISMLVAGNNELEVLIQNVSNSHQTLSKRYRKAIRVFNESDEDAHVFADNILKGNEESFIKLISLLDKTAANVKEEKIHYMAKNANDRHFFSWVMVVIFSVPFILISYILLDKKVKELGISENRFQLAVQGSNDGIWDWDIETNSNYFSPRFIELLGYSTNDEFPQTMEYFSSLLHLDDHDRVLEEVRKHIEEHEPYDTEYRLQMKDGSYKWFLARGQAIWDENGNPLRMAGSVSDISERKHVELALRDSEEWHRILIESSHEVIFSKDKDGRYHTANLKAAIGLGGERVKDIIGKTDYDLMPKEQADALRKLDQQVMEEQKPIEIEEVVPISESEIKTYLSHKWPTFNKEGQVSGIACFAMDITDIKKAELEVEKYRENLEGLVDARTKELKDAQDELVRKERLATLGQLTATVSHELRNPLGAIRPSLYILKKKSDKGDERIKTALHRIDKNIDRCDRIIDELLDFTRITELELRPTLIDEWLESVIDEQLLPEGIQIERDYSLKDIELEIDTDRLRRVIINVVENGCHSMMDDNQKLANSKDAHLKIKTDKNESKNRVEISITDIGSGIPEDILRKIYEPLFSTKGFGVGLGMPTVKQIMEQHGGGIDIESKEDKGTTVTLWLPMKLTEDNKE